MEKYIGKILETAAIALKTNQSYVLILGSNSELKTASVNELKGVVQCVKKKLFTAIVCTWPTDSLRQALSEDNLDFDFLLLDESIDSEQISLSSVATIVELHGRLKTMSNEVGDSEDAISQALTDILRYSSFFVSGFSHEDDSRLKQTFATGGRRDLPTYWLIDAENFPSEVSIIASSRPSTLIPITDEQVVFDNLLQSLPKGSVVKKAPNLFPRLDEPVTGQPKLVRVLSIDGGGIRGVIPALVLQQIEEITEKRIADLFDVIAGTSTGAILALGLAVPDSKSRPRFKAEELAQLYLDAGPKIFPAGSDRLDSRARFIHDVLSRMPGNKAKSAAELLIQIASKPYDAESGIDEVLEQYFGDVELKNLLVNVLATSYEIEQRRNFYWRRRDALATKTLNAPVAKVIRSSTAAPTFFTPAKVPTAGLPSYYAMVDGGIFANNPALAALVEAKTIYPLAQDFLVVSVGTGDNPGPYNYLDACNWVTGQWLGPLIQMLFHGSSSCVHEQMEFILPRGQDRLKRYYRLQTPLNKANESIDDASVGNITALSQTVAKYLATEARQDLSDLKQQLLASITVLNPSGN